VLLARARVRLVDRGEPRVLVLALALLALLASTPRVS
jgi:hypothetical protein